MFQLTVIKTIFKMFKNKIPKYFFLFELLAFLKIVETYNMQLKKNLRSRSPKSALKNFNLLLMKH